MPFIFDSNPTSTPSFPLCNPLSPYDLTTFIRVTLTHQRPRRQSIQEAIQIHVVVNRLPKNCFLGWTLWPKTKRLSTSRPTRHRHPAAVYTPGASQRSRHLPCRSRARPSSTPKTNTQRPRQNA